MDAEKIAGYIKSGLMVLAALGSGSGVTWFATDNQDRVDVAIAFQQSQIQELREEKDELAEKVEDQEWIIRHLLQQGATLPESD